jgi:hypothetical protein
MKVFRVATVTETRGCAEGLLGEFRSMMAAAWLATYQRPNHEVAPFPRKEELTQLALTTPPGARECLECLEPRSPYVPRVLLKLPHRLDAL